MQRKKRKHSGNSLIECVISIALIGIIIAGIVSLIVFISKNRMTWKEYDRLSNLSITIINKIEKDIRNNVDVESEDYDIHYIYGKDAIEPDDPSEPRGKTDEEYTTGVDVSIIKCKAYDRPFYRVKMKMSGQANTHLLVTTFIGGELNNER